MEAEEAEASEQGWQQGREAGDTALTEQATVANTAGERSRRPWGHIEVEALPVVTVHRAAVADSACSQTACLRSGTDAAAGGSTASAERRGSCSLDTWAAVDTVDTAGIAHTSVVAASSVCYLLRDHHPCRHLLLALRPPAWLAQPADDDCSSCRLGSRVFAVIVHGWNYHCLESAASFNTVVGAFAMERRQIGRRSVRLSSIRLF